MPAGHREVDDTQNATTLDCGDAGYMWLSNNAAGCGLHNLPRECWHWSTDGT